MKKIIKNIVKILLLIIVIVSISVGGGLLYLKANLLDFDKNFDTNQYEIIELNINGYKFLDRNGNKQLDIYEDDRKPIELRVSDLLSKLTKEEKVRMLKGSGMSSGIGMSPDGIPGAVGTIVSTSRLGIPEIYLSDGPAGLRILSTRENDKKKYYCTAFPIATLLASSWDKDLVQNVGFAMGNEALSYGIDVILGPGVNIHRHPLCGRNFEYYSEDPFLTGHIGAAMINGIESNGVGTSPKHFVANNQETSRNINDAIVSERALREIYLKGFEIIVKKSQPWTIMTSYNKINGTYAPENKRLLTDVLKNEWGFDGVVMTDWFGGKSATAIINAGNDLIEPGTKNSWNELKKSAEDGSLPLINIDASVKRILELIFKSRKMQNYKYDDNPDLKNHAIISGKAAAEGMILLKNNETLPMNNLINIALIGATSYDFISGGTGSGDVDEAYTVALDQALKDKGFILNKIALNHYEKKIQNNPNKKQKGGGAIETAMTIMNPPIPMDLEYPIELIKKTSKTADIAIITIGRNSGETADRKVEGDFLLSKTEKEMILSTCKVYHSLGKKVVVILNIGGVIETASWKDLPDAILLAWQGGQEGGNSVVDILTGKINPSGKLPMTFPNDINDHKSSLNFPMDGEQLNLSDVISGLISEEKAEEEKIKNKDYTLYKEGIYVGYRHFDKNNIEVSYPFGYGLSYTDFEYSDLKIIKKTDTIMISLNVKNIGNQKGKEIVQVYVSKNNSKIDRPLKELKEFSKTKLLDLGETIKMNFNIPIYDLSYWNEEFNDWSLEKGDYSILIGASSRDIKLNQEIDIK